MVEKWSLVSHFVYKLSCFGAFDRNFGALCRFFKDLNAKIEWNFEIFCTS